MAATSCASRECAITPCSTSRYSFGWLRWLERHEPDASIVALTMLLVAEAWHVAGWTDRPLHDEWFPTRAFVREFLAAGDCLSALTDEGVELPGSMQ